MEREEFTALAQEILGDRNDDKALEFAKACGEIFDSTSNESAIEELKKVHEEEMAELKADNDRLRNDYKNLFFKGKEAKHVDTEPILSGEAQGTPDAPVPILKLRGLQYDENVKTIDK